MGSVNNAVKHFRTITKHRHQVIKHCFKVGIPFRGLLHDLSKYGVTEFSKGVKYYQGTRSPNEGEREAYGYSLAWIHHKGVNKHHFEHWTDYDYVTKKIIPVKMPRKYVAEMFCDRVAASKIYQKEKYKDDAALAYFMKGKPTRFINKDTSDELEYLLTTLAEKGEKVAFAEVKRYLKGEDIIKRAENAADAGDKSEKSEEKSENK